MKDPTCYNYFVENYTNEDSSSNLIEIAGRNGIKWYQKWNDFVINYSGGVMKIYANKKLIEEKKIEDVSVDLNIANLNLYLGDKDESSINGHIKNAYFFTKPLSFSELKILNNF